MHELSIAEDIINVVNQEAAKAGAIKVDVVRLRVGALSGVVPDALRFSFARSHGRGRVRRHKGPASTGGQDDDASLFQVVGGDLHGHAVPVQVGRHLENARPLRHLVHGVDGVVDQVHEDWGQLI